MKPAPNSILLKEEGLIITEWHILVSGKRYPWSDAGCVQIQRITTSPDQTPSYELQVGKKGKPADTARAIFSTQNTELVDRMQAAIDAVAKKRGDRREI